MIKDLTSQYLQEDFKQMTNECFNEVSTMLFGTTSNMSLNNLVNNLKSDLHWFNQKVERILEMVKKDNIDLSGSNISTKFSELEELSSRLEEALLTKSLSLENSIALIQFSGVLSFILILLSMGAFFLDRRLKLKLSQNLNILLADSLDLSQEENLNLVLNALSSDKLATVLRGYIRDMQQQNKNLEEHILNMQTERIIPIEDRYEIKIEENLGTNSNTGILFSENDIGSREKEREITEFSSVINAVLDKVQTRAFHEAILLETDLADEFCVYSEQGAVEQLLFSLLEYSMDCAKSINEVKKVKFNCKALGGIAYCKVSICQYQFNDQEKAFLSGTNDNTKNMPINLILLRELVKDSGFGLAVKNKHNGSKGIFEAEVEIIFDRAMATEQSQANKIVKGSKAEIRKFLDNSL